MPQYNPMIIKGKGRALPQYQGSGQAHAPGQGVSARMDPGYISTIQKAAQGDVNGVEMLGNALDRAGKTAGELANQYGRIKGLQLARDYTDRLNEALYNKDSGLLSATRGESAFDVEQRIRETQERLHKDVLGDYGGSLFGIGMYFDQDVRDLDQRTYLQGMQHSAQEYNKWVPAQLLAAADTAANEALMNCSDPSVSQTALDRAAALMAAGMARQGAGPEQIGVAIEKMRHDYALNVAQGYIGQRNWSAARGVLSGDAMTGLGRGASNGGLAILPGATRPLDLNTVSGRNLANNNFGNVKTARGGWESYATRHDGLMGVGERLLDYSDRRGKKSLWDVLDTYCPDSEARNDTVGYCLKIGKAIGVVPQNVAYSGTKADTEERRGLIRYLKSTPLDVHDRGVLAGLIKQIPLNEHTANTVVIGDDEAMAAAADLLAGRQPRKGAPVRGEAGVRADEMPHSPEVDSPAGLVEPGNIDLYHRPVYEGENGEIRTVNSISVTEDVGEGGGERVVTVLPTIAERDGKAVQLTEQEAIDRYRQTGEHMGKFATEEDAERFAQAVHRDHEKRYAGRGRGDGGGMDAGNPLLTPAEKGRLMSQIEAGEKGEQLAAQRQAIEEQKAAKARHEAEVRDGARRAVQLTRLSPSEGEQKAALHDVCNLLPPEDRPIFRQEMDAELKAQKEERDARDLAGMAQFDRMAAVQGWSYPRQLDEVEGLDISREAKDKLKKRVEQDRDGADFKEQSAANLSVYYAWRDRNPNATDQEINSELYNTSLNRTDLEKALRYDGIRAAHPFSEIQPLITGTLGKDIGLPLQNYVYEGLMRRISGRPELKADELKKEIWLLGQKGKETVGLWRSTQPELAKAVVEGTAPYWRPVLGDLERGHFRDQLAEDEKTGQVFQGLPEWCRDLLVTFEALRQIYGITPAGTDKERQKWREETGAEWPMM